MGVLKERLEGEQRDAGKEQEFGVQSRSTSFHYQKHVRDEQKERNRVENNIIVSFPD